ncbi:hypothetical protein JCM11641_002235 [Rhodosporidiobolus odoratus]
MTQPRSSLPPSASRLSLTSNSSTPAYTTSTTRPANGVNGAGLPRSDDKVAGNYSISAVLAEPTPAASLLPSLPTLPSASSYLPSQLSSLSTTFTSAGTLPRSATPGAKTVAQRRSQAPPIAVTELRKVSKSEFEGYLKEVGDDFDRWDKESRAIRAGVLDELDDREGTNGELTGLGFQGVAGGKSSKPEEVLPALEEVPPIFFDPDFNLSNPRTFDLVTERIQLSPTASPALPSISSMSAASPDLSSFDHIPGLGPTTLNDLASDELLQDKLSHYTAVIESHLVREIGARSGAFFSALSNLQTLHQQGEDALGKIGELQSALGSRESGVGGTARYGLQILRSQARRRGLERIEEAVRAVEEVWSAVEGVKELVESGEWEGALEVSEGIEEAYYGSSLASTSASSPSPESPLPALPSRPSLAVITPSSASSSTSIKRSTPRLNLTKLNALRSLPVKLSLLRAQIAKSLEGELITVLEHEMDVGIEEHVEVEKAGKGRWKGRAASRKGKATETAASVLSSSSLSSAAATAAAAAGLAGVPEALEEEGEGEGEGDGEEACPEGRAKERAVERVRPVVRALVRAEGMDNAITAWRESVLREVRAMVREHLPAADTPTIEQEDQFVQAAIRSVSKQSIDLGIISEKSLSLAKQLRGLPHSSFLALATETFAGLLACIHVVDLQARVLLELYAQARAEEHARKARRRRPAGDALQPPSSPTSAISVSNLTVPGSVLPSSASTTPVDARSSTSTDDSSTLSTEIADVVHAVAELANVRFSKVIGVRTEVHAHLPLPSFLEIFDLAWRFVLDCEIVCQRMIVGLRGAMVSQSKSFLQQFHQKKITESARTVEEEQWAPVEVPVERQREVLRIVGSAVGDPVELLLGDRRKERLATASADNAGEAKEEDGELQPAKQVEVEGRQFFAVSAGLTTIGVLVEYLMVLLNCPMLTTDCMSKIVEFMKAFNSRTCQVVLGAGAMRSAGLKNITAKHLALASQALSIMVSLIPYIRECVRRHLNPKQAVMLTEFDKLKRDYQEHQHEIHAKLVAIMSDRLQVHSRTLETINWEEPSPRPGAPNAYMEALVKEHLTLHKVLSRFLHSETVLQILLQVFTALDARLAEVLGRVELRSVAAKERMMVDVIYLKDKLGGLSGLEGNGPAKDLGPLFQSKALPQPVARPSLPPRTSSMIPSVSPFQSPSPGLPAAAATDSLPSPSTSPLPPTPGFDAPTLARSPSATSLSLPRASADGTGSPRSSLDNTSTNAGSQPPSPVPVPAPLPPAPAPVGPAPYVSKKKTLADRLAERLGRKPAEQTFEAAASVPPALPLPEKEEQLKVDEKMEIPTIVEPVSETSQQPTAEQDLPQTGDSSTAPTEAEVTSIETAPLIVAENSTSSSHPSNPPTSVPKAEVADTSIAPFAPPVPVITPSAELDGLRLEGIEVPPVTTPLREELEEVEKVVEKELEGEGEAEKVRVLENGVEQAKAHEEDKVEGPVVTAHETEPVDSVESVAVDVAESTDATSSERPASPVQEIRATAAEPVEGDPPFAADASSAAVASVAGKIDPTPNLPGSSQPPLDTVAAPPAPATTVSAPEPTPPPPVPLSSTTPPASIESPVCTPSVPEEPPALPPVKPTPVSVPPISPPSVTSPTSSIDNLPSPTTPLSPTGTGATKKKTLKERLAEAARRKGSLGGSMVDVAASPPLAPVVAVASEASPLSVASPDVNQKPIVENKPEVEKKPEGQQEEGKVEAEKVECPPPVAAEPDVAALEVDEPSQPKTGEVTAVEEPIEEEESSFL